MTIHALCLVVWSLRGGNGGVHTVAVALGAVRQSHGGNSRTEVLWVVWVVKEGALLLHPLPI